MFQITRKRKNAFLLFSIVLAFTSIYAIGPYLAFGPGLPPAESMPQWYLPDSGIKEDNVSYFPFLSEYMVSGTYYNSTIVCVWYFEKEATFQEGEKKLYRYLLESGQVKTVKLNISEQLSDVISKRGNDWSPTFGSHEFDTTVYESNTSSGYFIVYRDPFIKGRGDYFITYYGSTKPDQFEEKKNTLMYLVARSYYNSEGNVTSLDGGKL